MEPAELLADSWFLSRMSVVCSCALGCIRFYIAGLRFASDSRVDQAHLDFGVSIPMRVNLAQGNLDLTEIAFCQHHLGGFAVFDHALRVRSAGDRNNPWLLSQHPGQGDLCEVADLACLL